MPTTASEAVRAARRQTSGHCLYTDESGDSRVARVRFVHDRLRGQLLLRGPAEILESGEAELLAPDEHDPAVALLLSIHSQTEPHGDAEIRHEVYHGSAREGRWITASIEALRYHGEPFDADELRLTDAILADEPRICRELNSDPARVATMCEAAAGASVESPVVVGVDPFGIDVRAAFGIVRLEFPREAMDTGEARAAIGELARGAHA